MQLDQAVLRLLSSKAMAPRQHCLGKHPRATNDSNTLSPYLRPPHIPALNGGGPPELIEENIRPGYSGKIAKVIQTSFMVVSISRAIFAPLP